MAIILLIVFVKSSSSLFQLFGTTLSVMLAPLAEIICNNWAIFCLIEIGLLVMLAPVTVFTEIFWKGVFYSNSYSSSNNTNKN